MHSEDPGCDYGTVSDGTLHRRFYYKKLKEKQMSPSRRNWGRFFYALLKNILFASSDKLKRVIKLRTAKLEV